MQADSRKVLHPKYATISRQDSQAEVLLLMDGLLWLATRDDPRTGLAGG